MKKFIKILLWTLVILIAIPVILIATLPLWLGPIGRPVVNGCAPVVLKTGFNLEKLAVNPYTGRIEVGGLKIENPAGYSEADAVRLGKFVFDLDYSSLGGPVIHIQELTVNGVFVSYVSKDGTNNIDAIVANLGSSVEEIEKEEEAELTPEEIAKRDEALAKIKAQRICIDKLEIRDVSAKVGIVPLAVPKVEMSNVGGEEGACLDELGKLILELVLKECGMVGGDVLKLGQDGAKALGELGQSGLDAVKNLKTDDAVNAAKAVGEGAGKTLDAVGEGAGKAVDAVGEGAGKAVDALKGLFK